MILEQGKYEVLFKAAKLMNLKNVRRGSQRLDENLKRKTTTNKKTMMTTMMQKMMTYV